MNVIPFIDIMLVLLAIVLTTATFVAEGTIPVSLPESRGATVPPDSSTQIEITVMATGALFFDSQPVSIEQLARRLDGYSADTRFLLRVDEDAAFRHFVDVVDLLKTRHMSRLSIVTRLAAG